MAFYIPKRALTRTRTQWSKILTADLTDPGSREPCGQFMIDNRMGHGCVLNPSLVLLFNQNLSPITVIIGCKMIGSIRLVQSSEVRVSQDPIDFVMGI